MAKVTPADDAKLQHLKTLSSKKIDTPINPGNKKVLLFTAFADTANYLYEHLAPVFFLQRKGLHTGKVTGTDTPKSTLKKNYDFQSLLTLFSPRSKEKALVLPSEPVKSTCSSAPIAFPKARTFRTAITVINYDIHWNPVRIIQRFGRIDRIGSRTAPSSWSTIGRTFPWTNTSASRSGSRTAW